MKIKLGKIFSIFIIVGFVLIPKPVYAPSQAPNSQAPNNSSEKSGQESSENSLEVRLSGQELYEALISQTVSQLDGLAREREALRWTIVGIITATLVGLATVVGITGYRDLREKIYIDLKEEIGINESIKATIEENVRKIALSRIDEKVEQLNKEVSLYKFSGMVSDLADQSRKTFSNAERDAVMEALGVIKDSKEIISRSEFLVSLEKIVDVFISADLDDYIDDLESTLGSIIEQYRGIVISLVSHYGMRVLGDIDVSDSTKARFFKYVYACRHHRCWELALPWLMVYEFSNKFEGWGKKVEDYFIDAQQLNADDMTRFFGVLTRYSDLSTFLRATGQIIRFTSKFQEFTKHYEKQISELTVDATV